MKVLVTDPLAAEGIRILREAGFTVEESGALGKEELASRIRGFDALLVRSATKVGRSCFEAADRLKVVGRAGVGLDNVDVEAATEKGVTVMNSPEGNTVSTAEHAFALLLSLARNIVPASVSVAAGKWEKKGMTGVELAGKTIGIFGFGRIGRRLAGYARAFEMEVLACDPFASEKMISRGDATLVEKDELLARSDIVTLHVPLTDETRRMIGERELGLMPEGSLLINCSRGGLVDEEALGRALAGGRLKGAALDVFEVEPPGDNPLTRLPGVVVTPHLGASTGEAQEKVARAICAQVVDFLKNGIVVNAANLPPVNARQARVLAPYQFLCEKMGSFLGQTVSGRVESIELKYLGEISDLDLSLLPHYFLKGFFSHSLGDSVNYVNAPLAARERGIDFSQTRSEASPEFANLVEASVRAGGREFSLAGTLFGLNGPRIVRIDDFLIDAVPEGCLLLCRNQDRPGIVGRVGSVLGAAGVNIAGLSLGRSGRGGLAMSLINLDGPVSPEVLDKVRRIRYLTGAVLVKL